MYIRCKALSAAFKALLCLGGLTGILLQCGVFGGELSFSGLRYYTLLSNILCVLYFGYAAVRAGGGEETVLPRFKATLIMGITVTGLVYHFMLSNGTFSMGGARAVSNILLHYFTPIMAVADWLLFDKKGRYTRLSPLLWVVLPDAYFVLAVIYAYTIGEPFYGGSRFPYFFIDFDVLGVWRVLLYVVALNVFFYVLGCVYYILDCLMAKGHRILSARSGRGAGGVE